LCDREGRQTGLSSQGNGRDKKRRRREEEPCKTRSRSFPMGTKADGGRQTVTEGKSMKVRYIYPPLFKAFYPMATRIITENLLRNPNLRVEFSDIPVKTFKSRVHNDIYHGIMNQAVSEFSPNIVAFLRQKYIVNNLFYVFMIHGYFDAYLYDEFDEEYVILTCINFCDLMIAKKLLENNKKVVIGGPLINIGLSPKFIRQFLYDMGVSNRNLTHNLIIVSGNIDLTTDIYQIIYHWKDMFININDYYSNVYECENDFLQRFYQKRANIPVHFGFNNRCFYGKCKFCTYKKLPEMNFVRNSDESLIVRQIRKIMSKYHSNHVRFIDSYYEFNNKSILNILNDIKDYDITIYTGIIQLKNKEYVDFINKYINCILIGLESTSNFSLKKVSKGYTYEDIQLALQNIIRYMDRSVFLEISLILDLPCEDEEDVKTNYERIAGLKRILEDEGFHVAFHMNILSVFPNMELLYTREGLLRSSSNPGDARVSSGKNYLVHLLRRAGMDGPLLLPSGIIKDSDGSNQLQYGYISSDVPVLRYGVDGRVLPSDLDLMDEDVMREILVRKAKRT